MSCARALVLLSSVVLYLVRVVHKFHFNLVINKRPAGGGFLKVINARTETYIYDISYMYSVQSYLVEDGPHYNSQYQSRSHQSRIVPV